MYRFQNIFLSKVLLPNEIQKSSPVEFNRRELKQFLLFFFLNTPIHNAIKVSLNAAGRVDCSLG